MKFGRKYRITIQTTENIIPIGNSVGPFQPSSISADTSGALAGTAQAIIIEPPFTITFNIHRTAMSALNGMTLQIYNLNATHRQAIYQDRFSPRRFKIIVEAGYDTLATVFIGDIFEANSHRQGTDIITTIDARDGYFGVNTGVIPNGGITLEKGTTLKEVMQYLCQQIPNVTTGTLSNIEDYTFSRPLVLEGNTYEQIKKYANLYRNMVYVDLEVINILGNFEVVVNEAITLIDASTGLIETPRRDNAYLTITTLFEPRIIMGQMIQLQSEILPQYNGLYKVIGATHKGIISEAVNGRCNSVFNVIGNEINGGFKTV